MNFSQILRRKRLEQGLTLEELAKRIGTSKQTVQKYETGVISNVPSDKIELLAKALNTPPAELVGWESVIKLEKSGASHQLYLETNKIIDEQVIPLLFEAIYSMELDYIKGWGKEYYGDDTTVDCRKEKINRIKTKVNKMIDLAQQAAIEFFTTTG